MRNRVDDDATIADFLILYVRSSAREGSDDVEPPRLWMKTLTSESLDRCGDELAAVVDEDWTHRIVNPCVLSPTVGANGDGINRQ